MFTDRKTFLLSFIAFALLSSASCEKDPPEEPTPAPTEITMPPLTHTGENTFGCYVDGELFVANEGPSVWSIPPVSGSFDESTRELRLQGTRYGNPENSESDNIKIFSCITENGGTYAFQYREDGATPGYRNWNYGRCDYFYNDFLDVGKITITYLNEYENIIAGTFYLNLYNDNCEQDSILHITEGRFDFRY